MQSGALQCAKVLEHAWNGFNVSLFAYGQTGSGKSFSMVGYGSERGIIPRASEVIFERIEANTTDVTFKVEASMMEIYNERVKGATARTGGSDRTLSSATHSSSLTIGELCGQTCSTLLSTT